MNLRPTMLDSGKPKYLALVDLLERGIVAGELRDGDRLPPQRELADQLSLTIATVTKAIREAARKGIVSARAGSGTFIRVGNKEPEANAKLANLSLNIIPMKPVERFLDDAFLEVAKRPMSDLLQGYEVGTGTDGQRRVMESWLNLRGLSFDPSRTLLTHGSQHALAACFFALTKPGDIVLCEEWTYTGIRRLAEFHNVQLVGVKMDDTGILPEDLKDKLQSTGSKVLIASATVQNPTTASMTTERRKEIAAICDATDMVLIEDDIYGHLSGENTLPLAAYSPQRVIHISSMSKSLTPAMRLGALVAPEHCVRELSTALLALHWTAPVFWISVLEILSNGDTLQKCLAAQRTEAKRRQRIYDEIVGQRKGDSLPSYHVWQRLPAPWRSDDFVAELAGKGVRVSPAHHFTVDTASTSAPYVRVCLGSDNVDELQSQLLKLRAVMSQQPLAATVI